MWRELMIVIVYRINRSPFDKNAHRGALVQAAILTSLSFSYHQRFPYWFMSSLSWSMYCCRMFFLAIGWRPVGVHWTCLHLSPLLCFGRAVLHYSSVWHQSAMSPIHGRLGIYELQLYFILCGPSHAASWCTVYSILLWLQLLYSKLWYCRLFYIIQIMIL